MRSQRLLMGDALARESTEADISLSFRFNGSIRVENRAYRHLSVGEFAGWALEVEVGELRECPLS